MALWRATPTVTGDIRFYGHPLGPVTLTPVVERFTVKLSFEHPSYRMWDERSNRQPHHRDHCIEIMHYSAYTFI